MVNIVACVGMYSVHFQNIVLFYANINIKSLLGLILISLYHDIQVVFAFYLQIYKKPLDCLKWRYYLGFKFVNVHIQKEKRLQIKYSSMVN